MAKELATNLKYNGTMYLEGTALTELPNDARRAADDAGILRTTVEVQEPELDEEEEDEDEDEQE